MGSALEPGRQFDRSWTTAAWRSWEVARDFHATDSVDLNVVVSGAVVLELDDSTRVALSAGDITVVTGNEHTWHNTADEPADVLSVILGAVREQSVP